MKKEVERDFAMKYVSVPAAINFALKTCTALLEKYAFAECIWNYFPQQKW